jgi:ABC-2 type transport system ATP-binding protein
MVAMGPVDELRASGGRQLEVATDHARPGWADGLPGVRVVSDDGARTVLELTEDADDQSVLKAALAAGPVRAFGPRRPSLTELFRHVVSQEHEGAVK